MIASTTTRISLNPLDHFPPSNYTFFCTYLPLKDGTNPEKAFEVLQKGLRRTFKQLPWLSGKVCVQSRATTGCRPGQLEIQYDEADFEGDGPLRQLHLNRLDPEEIGVGYEDLQESGFPLDGFEDEQLTTAEILPKLANSPDCFSAQANFLPGACLLVAGTQHAACDGTSYFDVWRIWAGNCDALQQPGAPFTASPPTESSDRAILDRIWENEGTGTPMPLVKPESWSLLDIQRPGAPKLEAAESLKILSDDAMQAAVFYISSENFSALQKHCNEDSSVRISGNDALSALIWRCMLKAKRKAALDGGRASTTEASLSSIQGRLFMTLDARPDISQNLPLMYLGNLSVINVCSEPLSRLTAPNTSLGTVAQTIRSVVDKATREALMDAYTLAREIDDLNKIRLNRGHTPNSFDMVLSSLLMYPVEGVSWGGEVFANGGRPEAVRPLMRRFNRASQVCFVMPRKAHGGVEFVLNLFEEEMGLLLDDEEFGRWAMHYSY
ncbi:uncharacterized protein TRUGW13939_09507 [Talaromyces rugulosus]|uniref:Trichothecene 3-O-acetyltransferase-like N-terminal domain-containing protein n=1 Tax=Talaromyces rugulosus TaxID=121627 RepID=A0A7H8R8V6_TALRU|nr:uncharacterized protein TRUGW13939_09507 [Talaromyces rugulosus]QKX62348.1 hypothetical protein TRUGW13939_09507 [Talaromyces rugulosus]